MSDILMLSLSTESILSAISKILTILFWFVIILIPLVVIHELGHYLMAKLFKVRVVEFGVGMPPRTPLWKKWKGTIWSLNWLPLGGFAKIYGDHDALDRAQDTYKKDPENTRNGYISARLDEIMSGKELEYVLNENGIDYDERWQRFEKNWYKKTLTTELQSEQNKMVKQLETLIGWELEAKLSSKQAFFNRGFLPKFFILIGGVLFNFLAAWIIIFGLLNFGHISKVDTQPASQRITDNYQITQNKMLDQMILYTDLPFAKAGIEPRDKLVSIDGKKLEDIGSIEEFKSLVQQIGDKEVSVVYINHSTGETKTVNVKPTLIDGQYYFGVSFLNKIEYQAKNFGSSFGATNNEVGYINGQIWDSLKRVWTGLMPNATPEQKEALNEVGGPVAVGGVGSLVYNLNGIDGILYLMATISLGLAIMNLLPLPVLDGGRILVALINKITGKRSRKIEAGLISITMIILIGLAILIAFKDIKFVKNI